MDPAIVAWVFVLVAAAELPDKTMIASLLLGSRGRPLPVWLGASAAFVAHVALAVAAGRLLELLPHRALEAVVAAAFMAGAAYLLVVPEKKEEERAEEETEGLPAEVRAPHRLTRLVRDPSARMALTAFVVIVVGEFGDLTQLLTVNLVAKTHQPLSVFVGASLGLIAMAAVAAFSGRALLKVVPVAVIRRLSGLVFLGLGAYSLYQAVGG
jgi:putative Ca2+/H+ antiporter (TMEM165/GDT1 family)